MDPEDMNMERHDFKSKSIDELWTCHMELTSVLARRLSAEKQQLEQRLQQLHPRAMEGNARRERRPYPRVFPQVSKPNPTETWAGRGKQPRWLTAQLRTGKTLDDFRIQKTSGLKLSLIHI